MSDNINKMDFKQLRNEVQLLRDELAIMKRKYEDIIYNLDDDNFSSRIVKEKGDMKTAIEQTEEAITLQAEKIDENEQSLTTLKIEADNITARVESVEDGVGELSAEIDVEKNKISAIVRGDYTDDLLNDYLTGIKISPNSIKMIDDSVYSEYNSEGLKFYDSAEQVEGWAIEPNSYYGGMLSYYVNGVKGYSFGSEITARYGYATTDMVVKALNKKRGRFVVDVTDSMYSEVKFVGLNTLSDGSPAIYVNERLLATQDWVLKNGGGGTAKFA